MTKPMSNVTMKELADLVSAGLAEIVVRVERKVRAEADVREQSLRAEIARLNSKLKAVESAARPRKAA